MAILSLYGCMTYDLNTTTGNAHIYYLIFCSFKKKEMYGSGHTVSVSALRLI